MEAKFLKVPPRVSRPDVWAQCQPKETKTWVEELPTANYAKVAQLISERLRLLNRIEGDPLIRYEILEIIRPALYQSLDYLRGKSVGTRFPLSQENSKLLDFMLATSTELAASYWSVAQALVNEPVSWRLEKKVATVAQRTLASLGQVLLLHYLYKRIEPKGIWLDIHQLYLSFQRQAESSVKDRVGTHSSKTSFVVGYKQLLMLRLAEPYSLLHSEVIELFVSLEKWAGMVNLELLENSQPPTTSCCVIDFQKDLAVSRYQGESSLPKRFGYLEISALLRLLADHKEFVDSTVGRFDAMMQKGAQLPLSLGLIEYLERWWAGEGMPAVAKLFGNRQSRLFLLGLRAIHQNLTRTYGSEEVIQSEWLAETRNDSGLLCDFPETERLSLGHLIAFRKLDSPKHELVLGVTSKVVNQLDGSVEFELQLLAGKPQAAGIQPVAGRNQTYQRTILFFTKEPAGRKTWIVVESKHIKQGDRLRLMTSREAVIAQIARRINIGSGCYLLECQILKKAS